jgi:hypothetical protein
MLFSKSKGTVLSKFGLIVKIVKHLQSRILVGQVIGNVGESQTITEMVKRHFSVLLTEKSSLE